MDEVLAKNGRTDTSDSSSSNPAASSPDMSALINSLQEIQNSIGNLSVKVQSLEQREAQQAALVANDPFAYGRQARY